MQVDATLLDIWHLLHNYTVEIFFFFYEYSVKIITSFCILIATWWVGYLDTCLY